MGRQGQEQARYLIRPQKTEVGKACGVVGVLPEPRLETDLDKVMGRVGSPGDEAA